MNLKPSGANTTPSFTERRAAMYIAQRYLSAANQSVFAMRHGLTPYSLVIRYANVLPDLMERYSLEEAKAKADELVCMPRDESEWEPA